MENHSPHIFYQNENIIMTLDPLGLGEIENPEVLGLIPIFAIQGKAWETDFKTAFTEQYQFGNLFEMKGGHITKRGVYIYRGDPDLFPLAVYETKKEKCYQYDYGIVAIRDKEEINPIFITRMD